MNKEKLTLGCDPELAIIGKAGTALAAKNYLTGGLTGRVGSDASGVQAELRPGVALNALDMTVRCKLCLSELQEIVRPYTTEGTIRKIIGGSFARLEVPIGGHIHIGGLPAGQVPTFVEWADYLGHAWWNKVDSPKSINARTALNYGNPSDIRNQPHGLEYRSLGSWMSSPKVAIAAISLIHLAAELALKELKPQFTSWTKEVLNLESNQLIPKNCLFGIEKAKELYEIGPINMRGDVLKLWGLSTIVVPEKAEPIEEE